MQVNQLLIVKFASQSDERLHSWLNIAA